MLSKVNQNDGNFTDWFHVMGVVNNKRDKGLKGKICYFSACSPVVTASFTLNLLSALMSDF